MHADGPPRNTEGPPSPKFHHTVRENSLVQSTNSLLQSNVQ